MNYNHKKNWTKDQEQFLLESYGCTTLLYISNKIGKSEEAVKLKIQDMTGSYDMHAAGGTLTARQVAMSLGVEHRTLIEWIRNRSFPARQLNKKTNVYKSYHHFIDPHDVWRWVAKNKERINFAYVQRGILLPEPDWLAEEIKQAVANQIKRPKNWTSEEDELAWYLYKGGVNYREIARRLNRPESGTQRRLTVIRKRKETKQEVI
jgi:hypothetical protein